MENPPTVFLSSPSFLWVFSSSRYRLSQVMRLLTLCVLLSLPILKSRSGNPTAGSTLLFGAPISLTGSTSTEGHLTLEGYQLWVKEVNAHGGIKVGNNTYQVQLKYYDEWQLSYKKRSAHSTVGCL